MSAAPNVGWIDGATGPIFCWYHPPKGTPRPRAVVLCEPYGPDRMNLHLTYRALAMALSEAGFATLRFDPGGTGDSSGSPRDPGFFQTWMQDFDCAAALLQARAGVRELVTIGSRLGGTLATVAAAASSDVESFAVWGPYAQGTKFLRGERALSRVSKANGSGQPAKHSAAGDESSLGFVYSSEAQAAIKGIRLSDLDLSNCRRARITAWDEDSSEDELAAAWTSQGLDVRFSPLAGACSQDSLVSQSVPESLISETVAWLLADETPGRAVDAEKPEASSSGLIRERIQLRRGIGSAPIKADEFVEERVVRFGADGGIFGIVTEPVGGAAALKPTLVLVNGGNNHRPGINRNYTEWARNAAHAGHATLRFDIRGLGDSPPLSPQDANVLYRRVTRDDVVAAVDVASLLSPSSGVVLCGLCAGAYQSYQGALIDDRVVGLVLIDLLHWGRKPPRQPEYGFLRRRGEEIDRLIRAGLSRIGIERKSELVDALVALTSRNVDVLIVACTDGKGYELVTGEIGDGLSRLAASGHFELVRAEGTNHIFTPMWAQAWLWDQLSDFLSARSEC